MLRFLFSITLATQFTCTSSWIIMRYDIHLTARFFFTVQSIKRFCFKQDKVMLWLLVLVKFPPTSETNLEKTSFQFYGAKRFTMCSRKSRYGFQMIIFILCHLFPTLLCHVWQMHVFHLQPEPLYRESNVSLCLCVGVFSWIHFRGCAVDVVRAPLCRALEL